MTITSSFVIDQAAQDAFVAALPGWNVFVGLKGRGAGYMAEARTDPYDPNNGIGESRRGFGATPSEALLAVVV